MALVPDAAEPFRHVAVGPIDELHRRELQRLLLLDHPRDRIAEDNLDRRGDRTGTERDEKTESR